jgi:hypothetical protein
VGLKPRQLLGEFCGIRSLGWESSVNCVGDLEYTRAVAKRRMGHELDKSNDETAHCLPLQTISLLAATNESSVKVRPANGLVGAEILTFCTTGNVCEGRSPDILCTGWHGWLAQIPVIRERDSEGKSTLSRRPRQLQAG